MERERALSEQLARADEDARLSAAQAFARDESLEPAQPLLGALKDESWRVRRVAVEGLSRRAAPDAIAALLASVRENHHHLGLLNSALQVLAMSDVDTLSPLVEFLNGDDADLRMQAALALGEQRDVRAAPALLGALEDADAERALSRHRSARETTRGRGGRRARGHSRDARLLSRLPGARRV